MGCGIRYLSAVTFFDHNLLLTLAQLREHCGNPLLQQGDVSERRRLTLVLAEKTNRFQFAASYVVSLYYIENESEVITLRNSLFFQGWSRYWNNGTMCHKSWNTEC